MHEPHVERDQQRYSHLLSGGEIARQRPALTVDPKQNGVKAMSISSYLKVIGRGARGARSLDRPDAEHLFAQVLDGLASDLEIGAFCLAMRIKGESPEEMAGFADAARARISLIPESANGWPTVVLPSYNGARKFPVLTGLLALLLASQKCRVIVHGFEREEGRTTAAETLDLLGYSARHSVLDIADGVNFVPVGILSAKLERLLHVRKTIGLRNSAHSLVKIINPNVGRALVVGSYTHSAYLLTMSDTYGLLSSDALLLRGIEGEAVADPRRMQEVVSFVSGARTVLQDLDRSSLSAELDWPSDTSAVATAEYINDVIEGRKAVPRSIAAQIMHIEDTLQQMRPV